MDGMTTHWLLDVVGGELLFQPCCQLIRDVIEVEGYHFAVGRTVESVVQEFWG